MARHGIECPAIAGAGTATFEFETANGDYTELQRGSYIFMVAHYGSNVDRDGASTKAFEPSLFVWTTVMIGPAQDRGPLEWSIRTSKRSPSICPPLVPD